MRFPLISRSSHEEAMQLLTSQVSDLKHEREILLDRLGTIGLGGPLFNGASQPDSSPSTAQEADQTEEEIELAHIRSLQRTPSKLAAYMTRKAHRDAQRMYNGPSVARIPDLSRINEALDQAEELGKKQA
jgi:hypothetical protein